MNSLQFTVSSRCFSLSHVALLLLCFSEVGGLGARGLTDSPSPACPARPDVGAGLGLVRGPAEDHGGPHAVGVGVRAHQGRTRAGDPPAHRPARDDALGVQRAAERPGRQGGVGGHVAGVREALPERFPVRVGGPGGADQRGLPGHVQDAAADPSAPEPEHRGGGQR